MHTGKKCNRCSTVLKGPFCHQCGQKYTGQKAGLRDVFGALLSGLFSIERGIWGAMYELTVDPRALIESYWRGDRYYYYSPGQMIFYALFVIGLHLAFIGDKMLGFNVTVTGVSGGAARIISPQLVFVLLLLPLFSVTTYLSFLHRKKSFPEHFISATYIFSYGTILCTLLSDLIYLIFGLAPDYVIMVFLLLLFVWGGRTFLENRKWYHYLWGMMKQLFVFIFVFLLLSAILFLLFPEWVNFSWVE